MVATLNYRGPQYHRRRIAPSSVWPTIDTIAITFFVSQTCFLLAMMIINIREYNGGSAYNDNALGNREFVDAAPKLAAWIAKWPLEPLGMAGDPALFANHLTKTAIGFVVAAYFVFRCFVARRYLRVVMIFLALLAVMSLPFIHPAIIVRFD